jgi:hypothetical protein
MVLEKKDNLDRPGNSFDIPSYNQESVFCASVTQRPVNMRAASRGLSHLPQRARERVEFQRGLGDVPLVA